MRKKWLALALSMAMVVGSITGCGGSDSMVGEGVGSSGRDADTIVECDFII